MSKLLKFMQGGISAVLENEDKESTPWFAEFSEWLKSLSGIIVSLSIFFGFVWEVGRMVATYVLTEGDVWLSAMLIVVTWPQIVASSISMAPVVLLAILVNMYLSEGTEKKVSTGFAMFGLMISVCVLILGFAFLRFWNYGNVCVKDLPVKSTSPWNLHCGWYELAYPGEYLSVLHWKQPLNAPGNLGAAIIVPTSNIVMQIGTAKTAPACWQWIRKPMVPLWMRFPPCEITGSGSQSTNSWRTPQEK